MSDQITIWHISDIHIRAGVYEDIMYAIEQLIDRIKTQPPKQQLVVIAGDVFENKNRVSQYDLECFHQILSIIPCRILIIPGNHDYVVSGGNSGGITTGGGLDLIAGAIGKYKSDKIFLYSKSGIYQIPELDWIDFHILSPIDNIIPATPGSAPMPGLVPNKVRIAVLHETIQNVAHSRSARLSTQDFRNYNLVLMGDIHEMQAWPGNIAYSGSLVQKNKGESLNHGCIKWTVSRGPAPLAKKPVIKMEKIFFKLLRAYIKIEARDNTLPGLDKFRENITGVRYCELVYKNCMESKIIEFSELIKQTFGRLDEVRRLIPELKSRIEDPNILQNAANEIIKIDFNPAIRNEFYNEVKYNPNERELINIYEEHNKIEAIRAHKWKLDYLKWSDLFCYGSNNYITFTGMSGLYGLIGRNKTGKSAILDVLIFILFNKQLRGDRKSIVNNNATHYTIECGFSTSDTEYRIIRSGNNTASNQTQSIQFLSRPVAGVNNPGSITSGVSDSGSNNLGTDSSGNWVSNNGPTLPQTYLEIRKIIGSYQDLIDVNIVLQELQFLANKNPEEQLLLMEKYFELDKFKAVETVIRGKIKDDNSQLKALRNIKSYPVERKNALYAKYLSDRIPELDRIDPELREETELQCLDELLINLVKRVKTTESELDKLFMVRDELNKKLTPVLQYRDLAQLRAIISGIEKRPELVFDIKSAKSEIDAIQSNIHELNRGYLVVGSNQDLTPDLKLLATIESLNASIATSKAGIRNVHPGVDKHLNGPGVDAVMLEIDNSTSELAKLQIKLEIYEKNTSCKTAWSAADLGIKSQLEQSIKIAEACLENRNLSFNPDCSHCNSNQKYLFSNISELKQGLKNFIQETEAKQLRQYEENLRKKAEVQNRHSQLQARIRTLRNDLEIIRDIPAYLENLRITGEISKLQAKVDQLTSTMQKAREHRQRQHNMSLDEKIKKQETMINELKTGIQLAETLESLRENESHLLLDTEILSRLTRAKEEIRIRQKAIQSINEDLPQLTLIQQNLKIELDTLTKIRKIEFRIASYDEYLKLMNMETGIPYKLLNQYCEIMQQNVNQILDYITDFQLRFNIAKKSQIILNQYGLEIPAKQASGSQKFIIELVIRICLLQSHPTLPEFLIIDEGFGCMDAEHLNKTRDLLEKLTELFHFNWVIVISHIDDLQTICKQIQIEFKDNKSVMRYGQCMEESTKESMKESMKKITSPDSISNSILGSDPKSDPKSAIIKKNNGDLYCRTCNKVITQRAADPINKHINTKGHTRMK